MLRLQSYGRWRRWASLRLILGFLQMGGAAFSLAMLIHGGVTTVSLIAVLLTGLLTTISVLLYGSRRQNSIPNQTGGRRKL